MLENAIYPTRKFQWTNFSTYFSLFNKQASLELKGNVKNWMFSSGVL